MIPKLVKSRDKFLSELLREVIAAHEAPRPDSAFIVFTKTVRGKTRAYWAAVGNEYAWQGALSHAAFELCPDFDPDDEDEEEDDG